MKLLSLKKEKQSKTLNILIEYNSILKSIMAADELNKKTLKKGLKKLAKVDILSYNELQKSGLVDTMLVIKKHEDKDVKNWGKGLISMWKAKFSSK